MSASPEALAVPGQETGKRLRSMLGLVQFLVLLGLLWKIQFFVQADSIYQRFPLRDPFFPDGLESVAVLRWSYLAAVLGAAAAVLATSRERFARPTALVVITVVEWLAVSVLLLHQGSYNDMTFLTSWWTVLWCLWLASQIGRGDGIITHRRATRLACVILSMVMLGAAVGKWTDEYWSGQVMFEIYFRDRDFWLFNLLRDRLDESQLMRAAMWQSRVVIVLESLAGMLLWCLPARLAGAIALLVMLAIPLMNNLLLFSVTLSLAGLACAALVRPYARS